MSLTLGNGPFAASRGGSLNVDTSGWPAHVVYVEPNPKHVTGMIDGEVVVASPAGAVLYETGILPVWYFRRDEVRQDFLEPSSTTTHCPFKGEASYWNLRVGDRVVEDAVWAYRSPKDGAPPELAGLVSMPLSALDAWYEEDEPVVGHPRDPYHRVDTRRTSVEVVVRVGDEEVARTTHAVKVFETGLPARYYLPFEDVQDQVLERSSTTTHCPYKGDSTYWDLSVGDRTISDAAWSYGDPLPEALQASGHVCFLADGVETTVDGRPLAS